MPVASGDSLYVGWAKQNITPNHPVKLMGYGWKGDFERVRDSLWVRSFVFRSGALTVTFVSYDLMLTPPAVAQAVRKRLAALGLPAVYFTAIHTHHGFGEWQTGPAGALIAGGYNEKLVAALVAKTVSCVREAKRQLRPTQVGYERYLRAGLVNNRLVDRGFTDDYLRVLRLRQSSGANALLVSFAAHATFLPSRAKELSADYPGAVVRLLERLPNIDFALFAAGAVGSHSPGRKENETLNTYAERVVAPLAAEKNEVAMTTPNLTSFAEVPMSLDRPQLRLFDGWQIRPWLFRWFFGDIQPSLTLFRLGDVVFIGLPADFSGMLYPTIRSGELNVIITSFNGDYIGYVIPDTYYHLSHREALETNWYGPHTGSYTVALINRALTYFRTESSD